MAEEFEAPASIVGIINYGLQLATSLQSYADGLNGSKKKLREMAADVNSTTSALRQLQDQIDSDRSRLASSDQYTPVLKHEGLQEIEDLALQCKKIYATLVIVVTKSGTPASKGKAAASFGDMPMLKQASLIHTLRWKWLEPRIKRLQEQLTWVKMKVLLNLQLAGIARVQLGSVNSSTLH